MPLPALSDPYNTAHGRPTLPPPKKLHPIFPKFLRVGPIFCFHYTGTPKAHQEIFGNCTLAHFQNLEILLQIDFQFTQDCCSQKNVDSVCEIPPITGPKCTAVG